VSERILNRTDECMGYAPGVCPFWIWPRADLAVGCACECHSEYEDVRQAASCRASRPSFVEPVNWVLERDPERPYASRYRRRERDSHSPKRG
jgi:hypothetical protein